MRHCLRLNADDNAPNSEKIPLVFWASLRFVTRLTFILSLARLSDAPGDDFQGQAIVCYTQDFRFERLFGRSFLVSVFKAPALVARFNDITVVS